MKFIKALATISLLLLFSTTSFSRAEDTKKPIRQPEIRMKATGFEAFEALNKHSHLSLGVLKSQFDDPVVLACPIFFQGGAIIKYQCCDPDGLNCQLYVEHVVNEPPVCYTQWQWSDTEGWELFTDFYCL